MAGDISVLHGYSPGNKMSIDSALQLINTEISNFRPELKYKLGLALPLSVYGEVTERKRKGSVSVCVCLRQRPAHTITIQNSQTPFVIGKNSLLLAKTDLHLY